MDEQSMLPFHDTPIAPRNRLKVVVSSGGKSAKPARSRDAGLLAALADPTRVVFLDVETTGLSWYYDAITVAGWMRDGHYDFHIAGEPPVRLAGALENASALVTFNGTLFDLRFLRKQFPKLPVPPMHIDLRYLAKRVGLSGGQKSIERLLGLPQRTNAWNIDGAQAVLLWHRYLRGNTSALCQLIEYNRYDVLGMCGILDQVLERLELHPDLWVFRPRFFDPMHEPARLHHAPFQLPEPRAAPPVTFQAMFAGTAAQTCTIVGIDLTGSETRPSGWSVLHGCEAVTDRLASDDEIVTRTVAEGPAVVSIDSPLSIPFGRTRVEDDDPGRAQFGIMRRCERELKRRGINVYPCLLPSMQGLTRRGMRLADRFRSAGVPVIESYPGAAQDIMGIPRKGAGVEFLKQGFLEFGIRGTFANDEVSHDELDAMTSAIVGSFFLSSRFEPLSGPSEDALIIPDLRASGQPGMVIGISGRNCAGKTTTARILERQGFAYTRFSLVVDDEIRSRGENLDRATRQRIGMEINRVKGQRWLCEKVLERVADQKHIVVDGLRFPEDHAFFVEQFGSKFIHLHIIASDGLRADRYLAMKHNDVPFEIADRQPVESRIDELRTLATAVLANESLIATLGLNVLNCLKGFSQAQERECLSRLL
jgi:predicted nuclease with RNAse H fold/dephospho-CoA kinase